MKKLIQLKLKILAKLILSRYKPDIVGITGSIGKTSAKEAIFCVLSTEYKTRCSSGNYNNEIGVPLTIIGLDSPGRSIIGWLFVFVKALTLILIKNKNYPEILVLELGVDRPGDMKYLKSIIKPRIGVITSIGPVHLEFFGKIENIQKEKGGLIEDLISGWAILNNDDERVKSLDKVALRGGANVMTYGFRDDSMIRALDVVFSFKEVERKNLLGINFKLSHNGSIVPVLLPNVIGQAVVYAALAGAAVGVVYGLNIVKIAQALRSFRSPRGRMNLIAGIKNTLIIDDTYNASPQSTMAALEILNKIPLPDGGVKHAVLGDMLELGSYSEEGHRKVGEKIAKNKINKLIVVGERSRDIARGAREAGMIEDNIFHFADSEAAKKFVQEKIKEGDLILIKGSQGMRMEKIVKEIMAEPMRAEELLVRQGREWN